MRKDIEFKTEDGVTLKGWHYTPDGAEGPVPTVVMAHGFSGVKELYLDNYAEVFADAGIGAIVYDHRNLGESEGEPRLEIDPIQQIQGYRDAITFAEGLPEVDQDRIGIWGSSYSGGHVLVVGATDSRVKCVVSQVPVTSGSRMIGKLVRADLVGPMQEQFNEDRRARYAGADPAMIPVVTDDPMGAAALGTPESWDFLVNVVGDRTPTWKNECTLRSVEMFMEYEPGAWIGQISPTPLMMIVGNKDYLTQTDVELDDFSRAREPKKLVMLDGGHFDPYVNLFEQSSGAARDWFVEHLSYEGRNA